MGTKTLGNTSPTGAAIAQSAQNSFWTGDSALSTTEEMWCDGLYICMHGNGGNRTAHGAVYQWSGPQIGGEANTATWGTTGGVFNWVLFGNLSSANNNGGGTSGLLYLASGINVIPGFFLSGGGATLDCDNGTGHYHELNTSALPNTWAGMGTDNFGHRGAPRYYISYFPRVTINSLTSTPVAPGQQFSITGRSYSAGINSISINGLNIPTYTVNSDTSITATVPVGAITGPIYIDSQAGTVTSSTNLTIVGMHVFDGGAWQSGLVYVFDGAVWQPASGVDVFDGSAWQPAQ